MYAKSGRDMGLSYAKEIVPISSSRLVEHSARKSSLYLTFCTESNCIGSLRFCIRPHLVKSLTYTFKATKVPGYDDILPKVVKSVMKLLRTDFAVQ